MERGVTNDSYWNRTWETPNSGFSPMDALYAGSVNSMRCDAARELEASAVKSTMRRYGKPPSRSKSTRWLWKTSAARAFYFDSKPLVGLFIEQGIRFCGAQNMPIEPVRALRDFVFDGVEQRAIVGSPGDAGDTFESLGKSSSGAQVFDLKQVLAEAGGVGRIRKQVIVFADLEASQSKKRMAFRKQIQVEQQFFRRGFRVAPPAMERVLLSFLGTREIVIATEPIGNGKIRLQDAPQHFLIELFLKCLCGLQNGVGIGVFRLQISHDLRIFFVAEPCIVVDTAVAMQNVLYRFAPGNRGLENCTC